MYSALYYPHTSIESESLIKTALLLWDQIEYIVPYDGFEPEVEPNGEMAQALELVAKPHCPTVDERKLAHMQISDLVEKGVPEPFKYRIGVERATNCGLKSSWQKLGTYLGVPD